MQLMQKLLKFYQVGKLIGYIHTYGCCLIFYTQGEEIMDILGIAHEINYELGHIGNYYGYILSPQKKVDIFNSIVTCLTSEYADVIELSIRNCRNHQEIFKWSYDLSDKKYPQRKGEDIETILTSLKKITHEVYLDCNVKWSSHFSELDPKAKDKALRNTIWDKNYTVPSNPDKSSKSASLEDQHETSIQKLDESNIYADYSVIEYELLKLASETELLNNTIAKQINADIKMCLLKRYIKGVEYSIIEEDKIDIISQWRFELTSNNHLARSGEVLPQIITKYSDCPTCCLKIQVLFTEEFENMPLNQKQSYMKDTIFYEKDSIILKKKEVG